MKTPILRFDTTIYINSKHQDVLKIICAELIDLNYNFEVEYKLTALDRDNHYQLDIYDHSWANNAEYIFKRLSELMEEES